MQGFWSYAAILAPLVIGVGIAQTLERFAAWRPGPNADGLGWLQVALLYAGCVILSRGVLPITQTGASLWAADAGFGLFHAVEAPLWLTLLVTILCIDLWDYARHWALHRWGPLWRLHRVHHSATHIDVSVAFRFHPFEALLGTAGHVAIVLLLGGPAEAIVVQFALAVVSNYWTHGNFATPQPIERWSSYLLVTPGLHRIHHDVAPGHMGANFGVLFSFWDRMFGTLVTPRSLPGGMATLEFGLGDGGRMRFDSIVDLFVDPFRRTPN